jgi:energy-coupling factor transporter ATP-binding protein EcfA2
MTTTAQQFETLYQKMDILTPLEADVAADKALYVPGLHTSGNQNPVDKLLINIKLAKSKVTPESGRAWLFTGHRGVGKSTELKRLAHELRQQDHTVVMVDMLEYISMEDKIETETLLLAIAAAFSDAADHDLGGNRLEQGYLKRFVHFLTNTDIALDSFSAEHNISKDTKLTAKLLMTQKVNLVQQLANVKQGLQSETHAKINGYVSSIVKDYKKARADKPVVIVLDSLERLRVASASDDTAKIRYEAICATFDTYARFLILNNVQLIYSVPPYLPYLIPNLGSVLNSTIVNLAHTKILDKQGNLTAGTENTGSASETATSSGSDLFLKVLTNRYSSITNLIPHDQLITLIKASSGSLRDLMRLVRDLCVAALTTQANTPLQDNTLVDQVILDAVNNIKLSTEDFDWLKRVHQTQGEGLEKNSDLFKLARLFDSGLILSYKNGKDWCDVFQPLHASLEAAARLDAHAASLPSA